MQKAKQTAKQQATQKAIEKANQKGKQTTKATTQSKKQLNSKQTAKQKAKQSNAKIIARNKMHATGGTKAAGNWGNQKPMFSNWGEPRFLGTTAPPLSTDSKNPSRQSLISE